MERIGKSLAAVSENVLRITTSFERTSRFSFLYSVLLLGGKNYYADESSQSYLLIVLTLESVVRGYNELVLIEGVRVPVAEGRWQNLEFSRVHHALVL